MSAVSEVFVIGEEQLLGEEELRLLDGQPEAGACKPGGGDGHEEEAEGDPRSWASVSKPRGGEVVLALEDDGELAAFDAPVATASAPRESRGVVGVAGSRHRLLALGSLAAAAGSVAVFGVGLFGGSDGPRDPGLPSREVAAPAVVQTPAPRGEAGRSGDRLDPRPKESAPPNRKRPPRSAGREREREREGAGKSRPDPEANAAPTPAAPVLPGPAESVPTPAPAAPAPAPSPAPAEPAPAAEPSAPVGGCNPYDPAC